MIDVLKDWKSASLHHFMAIVEGNAMQGTENNKRSGEYLSERRRIATFQYAEAFSYSTVMGNDQVLAWCLAF